MREKDNPFMLAMQSEDLVGRKELLGQLEKSIDDAMNGKRLGSIIHGPRGIGKSIAMRKMLNISQRYGMLTAAVILHSGDDESSLVRKIIEQIENSLGIILSRTESMAKLVQELEVEAKRKEARGIVLLLDNLSEVKDYDSLLKKFSDIINQARIGLLIAVSSTVIEKKYAFSRIAISRPIKEEIEAFASHLLNPSKIKIGKECMELLIENSGRNPLILLTALKILYDRLPAEEKIISKAHYLQCIHEIIDNLTPLFDDLYYKASKKEKEILLVLARQESMHISELAKRLKWPLNTASTLALRLAKKGSLTKIDRGIYQLFNPLYGRYVLAH